jgi:hypothetical protein
MCSQSLVTPACTDARVGQMVMRRGLTVSYQLPRVPPSQVVCRSPRVRHAHQAKAVSHR